jgi:hypothetical protein
MNNDKINLARTLSFLKGKTLLFCFFLTGYFPLSLLTSTNVRGAVINVNTVVALQTAIDNANSGDIIILANGTYLNNTLIIGTSNITVKAATPGGVFLNGTNSIIINSNYVNFSGFQFTSGSITGNIFIVNGSHNNLTQLNFKGYSAQKCIVLNASGQYNEISYSNFENKPSTAPAGNLIHVDPSSTAPGYHKIRYCSFQNMPGLGGDNGNECIRISNGSTSTYVSRTLVEYNYFSNTGLGDSEAISVKCQENVLRYNTMNNNQKATFCFRNGNNSVAYGNFFINSGGIRVKEANNIYCYNNYFENCGDGIVSAPVKYVYISPNLNNINFIHNTFLNGTPIELDIATSNTWANNIFKNTTGNIFSGSTSGKSFFGNIYNGTLGVSISSGMTNIDPQLITNTPGLISSNSPAINAANASYPAILDIVNIDDDPNLLLDINGKTRPDAINLKDVGSVEYNGAGTSTNHPLTLAEVGPSYLSSTILPVKLLSFTATKIKEQTLLLWSTANEQNSSHFEIERSLDGLSFDILDKIMASGNSKTLINYSFMDKNTALGTNYYRLKQVDLDGKTSYSAIQFVSFKNVNISIQTTLVKDMIDIKTNDERENTLNFFNTAGQKMLTLKGKGRQLVNVSNFPSGIYFISTSDGDIVKFLKL